MVSINEDMPVMTDYNVKVFISFFLDFMNAVILTTVLSAGNSGLYASSRTLYDLANEGRAPKIFRKVTRYGVPIYCVLLTTLIGGLAFLSSLFGNGKIIYSRYAYSISVGSLIRLNYRRCLSMVDFHFRCCWTDCMVEHCCLSLPVQKSLCFARILG